MHSFTCTLNTLLHCHLNCNHPYNHYNLYKLLIEINVHIRILHVSSLASGIHFVTHVEQEESLNLSDHQKDYIFFISVRTNSPADQGVGTGRGRTRHCNL